MKHIKEALDNVITEIEQKRQADKFRFTADDLDKFYKQYFGIKE